MPDIPLAQNGDLVPGKLVEFVWRQDRSTAAWYSFYVLAPGKRARRKPVPPMRKYHGGWNGERVAGHSDMRQLKERYPEIYNWMLQVLKDIAT